MHDYDSAIDKMKAFVNEYLKDYFRKGKVI